MPVHNAALDTTTLVRPLSSVHLADAPACGRKAACLGELSARGYTVPASLVVPTAASAAVAAACGLEELLQQCAEESTMAPPARLQDIEQEIAAAFERVEMPDELADQLQAWTSAHGERFAVRSSGTSEDLRGASFAGLYQSFLDVSEEHVPRAVLRCLASLFTARAAIYRRRKGLAHLGSMAVIVQRMVHGEHGGVVFTQAPRRPSAVLLECAAGADDVVSGRVTPSRFYLNRDTLHVEEALDRAGFDILSIRAVARVARAIEAEFGVAQDIEYVVARRIVYILQARPASPGAPVRA